jgi:hypothetical protein
MPTGQNLTLMLQPLLSYEDRPLGFPSTAANAPGFRSRATRNAEVIRRWARAHQAEPATGEASASGPATVAVTDGGVGIRFNFPGFAPFRPISWDEWLAHFSQNDLVFVFEEQDDQQIAARAYEISRGRGGAHGHDRQDWFQAEHEFRLRRGATAPALRYRFVKDGPPPQ